MDILVSTPDRLKEVIDNEKVDLSEIKHVILDETDRMVESDVIEDVKKILKQVFSSGNYRRYCRILRIYFFILYINQETKPQLVVFSKTLPDSVRKLTKKYLSADVVTINMAEKNSQEASNSDEVKFE